MLGDMPERRQPILGGLARRSLKRQRENDAQVFERDGNLGPDGSWERQFGHRLARSHLRKLGAEFGAEMGSDTLARRSGNSKPEIVS